MKVRYINLQYLGIFTRRQDSSIGFGAPVRANMRASMIANAAVTSSLLETVRIRNKDLHASHTHIIILL